MKQTKWGKIISTAVILLSLAMVLIIVFTDQDLANVWDKLLTLDKGWLAAALVCYAGYVLAEGAGLFAFLRMEGFRVRLSSATHFSFAGIFYSNVTPSSSGGQPMQIYLMAQRGVPAGVATSALTARYFFNQLVLVVMTGVLWLMNRDFAAQQVGHVAGLILLGMAVNFACVPIIVAVLLNRRLVERITLWCIRLMAKWRICKHPEVWEQKALGALANFHDSLMDLVHHPLHLLIQLAVSVAEMTALMLVPLCVYRALGLSGTPMLHLLTVSFMLFVSASYTPLPGASGAQEGGFLVYFAGIFPSGTISVALLVWRFLTYYLCLLVGGADAVWIALRKRRDPIGRGMMNKRDENQPDSERTGA